MREPKSIAEYGLDLIERYPGDMKLGEAIEADMFDGIPENLRNGRVTFLPKQAAPTVKPKPRMKRRPRRRP